MDHLYSDLNTIVLRNKKAKTKAQSQRDGQTESQKKFGAGGNRTLPTTNMKKLDEDTESTKVDRIDKKVSKRIVDARVAKKLKQTDLAKQINILPSLLQKYENGSAIPDISIILKLQKKLGVKLTGKEFK